MADFPIKYALDIASGKLVHINDAKNGRACNCKCVECSESMDAIQGNIRDKHFRHINDSSCTGGKETSLHLRAKQIILDNNQIAIPGETLTYSNARKEEAFLTIRPDVIVAVHDKTVFFEIAVTNPKTNIEKAFFINGKHNCFEIDLTNVAYDVALNELTRLVLHETHNKNTIYWYKTNMVAVSKDDEPGSWWKNFMPYVMILLLFTLIYRIFKKSAVR